MVTLGWSQSFKNGKIQNSKMEKDFMTLSKLTNISGSRLPPPPTLQITTPPITWLQTELYNLATLRWIKISLLFRIWIQKDLRNSRFSILSTIHLWIRLLRMNSFSLKIRSIQRPALKQDLLFLTTLNMDTMIQPINTFQRRTSHWKTIQVLLRSSLFRFKELIWKRLTGFNTWTTTVLMSIQCPNINHSILQTDLEAQFLVTTSHNSASIQARTWVEGLLQAKDKLSLGEVSVRAMFNQFMSINMVRWLHKIRNFINPYHLWIRIARITQLTIHTTNQDRFNNSLSSREYLSRFLNLK